MKATLTFDNVEFGQDNGQTVRVALGEKFKMTLGGVADGASLKWATVADPVTDLREAADGMSAEVEATNIGAGEIQLQNPDRSVQFYLVVEVYNASEAVSASVREIADEPRT